MIDKNEYHKKSLAYVQTLENNLEFIEWVKEMRGKYLIVPDKIKVPSSKCIKKKGCGNCSLCNLFNNKKLKDEILRYIDKKLGLSTSWQHTLLCYLITEEWMLSSNETEIDVVDQFGYLLDRWEENKNILDNNKIFEEFLDLEIRPISIRISPYTTQRDLREYINKHFEEQIKPMQDFWKKNELPLGKTRNKNPLLKNRNDFIYDYCDIPIKKLTELVNAEFPRENGKFYDYTYIQSILKKEKRKRK